MRWIIFAVAVFAVCNFIIVSYWRDSQVDLSLSNIIFYMLLLPVLLIAFSYMVIATYKKIKQKKEAANTTVIANESVSTAAVSSECSESLESSLDKTDIRIYATALQSSEGSDAVEIIEALKTFKAAQLDPELVGPDGVSVITRRIDLEIDELENINNLISNPDNFEYEDASTQRTAMIYQRLLQSLAPELSHIAQGMAQFNIWRSHPTLSNENTLHPAWVGTHLQAPTEDAIPNVTDVVASMPKWPFNLRICYFLSERLNNNQINLFNEYLQSLLVELGFMQENIILELFISDKESSQSQQVKQIINSVSAPNNDLFLIVGADSSIDQEYIDDVMWNNPHYKAAEFGYAMLLSNMELSIPEIETMKYLSYPVEVNTQNKNINKQEFKESINSKIKKLMDSKYLEFNEKSSLISNINASVDHKKLALLSETAQHLNISSDQILLSNNLLETVEDQAIAFALVLASSISKDLQDAPQFVYVSDTEQISLWLLHDRKNEENKITNEAA